MKAAKRRRRNACEPYGEGAAFDLPTSCRYRAGARDDNARRAENDVAPSAITRAAGACEWKSSYQVPCALNCSFRDRASWGLLKFWRLEACEGVWQNMAIVIVRPGGKYIVNPEKLPARHIALLSITLKMLILIDIGMKCKRKYPSAKKLSRIVEVPVRAANLLAGGIHSCQSASPPSKKWQHAKWHHRKFSRSVIIRRMAQSIFARFIAGKAAAVFTGRHLTRCLAEESRSEEEGEIAR